MIEIARALKAHRKKLGLSQKHAAEGIGISYSTVFTVEHGRHPTRRTVRKIATWMGLDCNNWNEIEPLYREIDE